VVAVPPQKQAFGARVAPRRQTRPLMSQISALSGSWAALGAGRAGRDE